MLTELVMLVVCVVGFIILLPADGNITNSSSDHFFWAMMSLVCALVLITKILMNLTVDMSVPLS